MKLFIFLILSTVSFSVYSQQQEPASFPVTGTYLVTNAPDGRTYDFDMITVNTETFSLLMNDQVIRSYRIESPNKAGFKVAQYFPETAQPETFTVKIRQIDAEQCDVTIVYPAGSEKIHLVKQ